MTDVAGVSRTSKVVSVSLTPEVYRLLEKIVKREKKSRSALFKEMIRKYSEDKRWEEIYAWGEATARKFKITSEEDVLRLIDD